MRIYFSVGEPSGDLHGANLIRRLRQRVPNVLCEGMAGPKMAAEDCRLDYDLTQHAVMFFGDVLKQLPRFWKLLSVVKQSLRARRPDAVVLIDYPGFNWHVARMATALGIPVFYYGVPQLWAWASWRIGKMRRYVDHALCKLPFEADWYAKRGCAATYVGHPYFDELAEQKIDQEFVNRQQSKPGKLVTILPGSRKSEVETNLPAFLKAAAKIRAARSDVRFAVASFNERQGERARHLVGAAGLPEDFPIQVHVNKTAELIHLAHSCLACSGSVSLELLHHEKPSVVHYAVSPFTYWLGRRLLVNVRYITLANLLAAGDDAFNAAAGPYDPDSADAKRIPFPEYPTCRDESSRMADHILTWLAKPSDHQRVVSILKSLRQQLDVPGASARAADWIVQSLATSSASTSSQSETISPVAISRAA
jgi:lipid-A-disaccharide synthase